jgi:alpha-ketoglutarate-dependent taurine dioxygenase
MPRVAPKVVRVSSEHLVARRFLGGEPRMPLVLEPNGDAVDLAAWAAANREHVHADLLTWGAILFRGFSLSAGQFADVARAISPALLDYQERAAPRHEVAAKVYTSTGFPADQSIPLHHEMSYAHNWPTRLFFFCEQPAQERGATPIADDRRVFEMIDERIKRRFIASKVMYVRNYGPGLDTWQDVFQTGDPRQAERYCREAHIDFAWSGPDTLRTRQVRQAVMRHPTTGEPVWFNHAILFHESNLPAEVRDALLETRTPEELPRNAFYGDGSPIEASVLDEIREVYARCAVTFPWQRGDLLLLDNFLAVHGREPYVGPRKVLVAMAELFTNLEL